MDRGPPWINKGPLESVRGDTWNLFLLSLFILEGYNVLSTRDERVPSKKCMGAGGGKTYDCPQGPLVGRRACGLDLDISKQDLGEGQDTESEP